MKVRALNEGFMCESYGGAYDISDEQYFTRDELNEFAEYVADVLNTLSYSRGFDWQGCWLTDGILELELVWGDYSETIQERIDMRRIHRPTDLIKRYAPLFIERAKGSFIGDGADFGTHPTLDEAINSSEPAWDEIQSMRDEQREKENRRERFKKLHSLFDTYMEKDPNAGWIDRIYQLFEYATEIKVVTLPSRIPQVVDGQKVKYRFSFEDFDVHTDAYEDYIYIVDHRTKMNEDLEDDMDLLTAASDCKCKLSHYDMEEACDYETLVKVIKMVYEVLNAKYGSNIKYWKFDDTDKVTFGYKVFFTNGDVKCVEVNGEDVIELKEDINDGSQYIIVGVNGSDRLYYCYGGEWSPNIEDAEIFDRHDRALEIWMDIPKGKFKRVFIPVYDKKFEKSLTESVELGMDIINEIRAYFKEVGASYWDVDISKRDGKDMLCSEITDGDWKHDHMAIDHYMDEFFRNHPKYEIIDTDRSDYIGSDGDWYTETHWWEIGDKTDTNVEIEDEDEVVYIDLLKSFKVSWYDSEEMHDSGYALDRGDDSEQIAAKDKKSAETIFYTKHPKSHIITGIDEV